MAGLTVRRRAEPHRLVKTPFDDYVTEREYADRLRTLLEDPAGDPLYAAAAGLQVAIHDGWALSGRLAGRAWRALELAEGLRPDEPSANPTEEFVVSRGGRAALVVRDSHGEVQSVTISREGRHGGEQD